MSFRFGLVFLCLLVFGGCHVIVSVFCSLSLHCVQGSYPAEFLKAWDAFAKRKGSENDRPGWLKSLYYYFTRHSLKFIFCPFESMLRTVKNIFKATFCVTLFRCRCLDFFENDQLFIILEFEFGGVDLENSNGKVQ